MAEVGDGLGMATGMLVAGSPFPPQMPVWPSDVPTATAPAPRRPFAAAVALAAAVGAAPFDAVGDSPFHARRGNAAQPAGGARHGPRKLGGAQRERDHEADHDQAHEQDERARAGDERDQELFEEPADSPAASLDPEELDAEDLEAAEEADERDGQTDDALRPIRSSAFDRDPIRGTSPR